MHTEKVSGSYKLVLVTYSPSSIYPANAAAFTCSYYTIPLLCSHCVEQIWLNSRSPALMLLQTTKYTPDSPSRPKIKCQKSALHSILCLQPQPVMNKVNKLYLLPGITRHNVFHFSVEENMDCCCWFFLFYTWLWGQASHNIFCIQKYL